MKILLISVLSVVLLGGCASVWKVAEDLAEIAPDTVKAVHKIYEKVEDIVTKEKAKEEVPVNPE